MKRITLALRSETAQLLGAILAGLAFILAAVLLYQVDVTHRVALILLAAPAAFLSLIFLLRKPAWVIYAAVFVVLLPANLIPANLNSLINRGLNVLAFAAWFAGVMINRRKVYLSASGVLMLFFIVWAALSLLWAAEFSRAVTVLQMYALRWILFMLVIFNVIRTRQDLDGLMNTIAVSGGLLMLVSLATILIQGYSPDTRLRVLGENENYLGVALLVTNMAVIWWARRAELRYPRARQLAAVVYVALSFGLIGLSGSRGSAISLAITLLAFTAWKPTRPIGLLSVAVLLVGVLAAPFVFSNTIARFLGAPGETLLGGRESLWPAGFQLIQDHPLIGVGVGNSIFDVIPYLPNPAVAAYSEVGAPLHNPVLVVLAETGLVGLSLYLSFLAAGVLAFARYFVHSPKLTDPMLRFYYPLVAATLLGYLASWIKGGAMETDFFFYLLISMLWIPIHLQDQNERS